MKFCKDCKFFTPDMAWIASNAQNALARCGNTADLVTGEPIERCKDERSGSRFVAWLFRDFCGPAARFFQPK